MRKKIVAGNWKMNGTRESVANLLTEIRAGQAMLDVDCELIVLPSFVYLAKTEATLLDSDVAWGAQDLCVSPGSGAYTGEISGEMLLEFGCRYVLIGHSERRNIFGDTDEIVTKKFSAAKIAGLTPILCVGETLEQREQKQTEQVIKNQLDAIVQLGHNSLSKTIIAYEPVWAIGTGKSASAQQAQDVHAFIRQYVAKFDQNTAEAVSILYGGSVKGDNAREIFHMPDVDGGLIGGASLQADTFLRIASCNK